MQNINQTLTPNKYNRSISKNKVKILGGIEEKKSIMYK